jgi:hypothetical protein
MRIVSTEQPIMQMYELGSQPLREQIALEIETLENPEETEEDMTLRDTWFPINITLPSTGAGAGTNLPTTPTLTDEQKRKRAIYWGVAILGLLIAITLLIVFMRKKK